jgi:hypothetical protein
MSQSPNRILNSLPQNIFAALEPHLKIVNLPFGSVISETDQFVSTVYFPHSGIISLVVEMEIGDMIETAMVGRDGVVNATSALDGNISLHRGLVQSEGAASVISPGALRKLADEFAPFRSILIRHEQVLGASSGAPACRALPFSLPPPEVDQIADTPAISISERSRRQRLTHFSELCRRHAPKSRS